MLAYLKKSLENVDENGEKIVSAMFTEDIMGVLDILIIFMKLKEKLGDKSRLYSSYVKFKQDKPEVLAQL